MDLIFNPVVARSDDAAASAYLPYSSVGQEVIAPAALATKVAALQTWKDANPTLKILTNTLIMGDDGNPGLLVEHNTETSHPTNAQTLQQLYTAADPTTLTTAIQTWKTANPDLRIVRSTRVVGTDGNVGVLIEYTSITTAPFLKNSQLSQTFFPEGGTSAYNQYRSWLLDSANAALKPYRVTYVIADDGNTGILLEYTSYGSTPNADRITPTYIPNDNSTGVAGFANNLQTHKTANPTKQIFRVTPVLQGFMIEYTTYGSSPNNNTVSQDVSAAPTINDAATSYQTFKTANPDKYPIRLTSMTWGDGTNSLIAEYIS